VDGRVRVQLKNRSFLISPGTFLILPEQTPHSLELIKGHKHLHQIALHFHLQDRWKRSLLSRYPAVSGKLNDPEETMRALSELTCLLGHDRETGQAFGTALVQSLLASQLRKHALTSENLPKGDQRISRALQRMERELSSPNLSVEELAYSVGLSPVQFRKLFLRDMREGPKQFLQGLRMRHALWLLRHTDAAVKDVAAQCGFASDHYFHLAFHQKHGQTPSQYRSGPQLEI